MSPVGGVPESGDEGGETTVRVIARPRGCAPLWRKRRDADPAVSGSMVVTARALREHRVARFRRRSCPAAPGDDRNHRRQHERFCATRRDKRRNETAGSPCPLSSWPAAALQRLNAVPNDADPRPDILKTSIARSSNRAPVNSAIRQSGDAKPRLTVVRTVVASGLLPPCPHHHRTERHAADVCTSAAPTVFDIDLWAR